MIFFISWYFSFLIFARLMRFQNLGTGTVGIGSEPAWYVGVGMISYNRPRISLIGTVSPNHKQEQPTINTIFGRCDNTRYQLVGSCIYTAKNVACFDMTHSYVSCIYAAKNVAYFDMTHCYQYVSCIYAAKNVACFDMTHCYVSCIYAANNVAYFDMTHYCFLYLCCK